MEKDAEIIMCCHADAASTGPSMFLTTFLVMCINTRKPPNEFTNVANMKL